MKAEIAIKLFGDDLDVLAAKGREIERAIRGLNGATGVKREQITGEAELVIRADHEKIRQEGLNVDDVMNVVEKAVGGETIGQIPDGERRFDIYMRIAASRRGTKEQTEGLIIEAPPGAHVPLARAAPARSEDGARLGSPPRGRRGGGTRTAGSGERGSEEGGRAGEGGGGGVRGGRKEEEGGGGGRGGGGGGVLQIKGCSTSTEDSGKHYAI